MQTEQVGVRNSDDWRSDGGQATTIGLLSAVVVVGAFAAGAALGWLPAPRWVEANRGRTWVAVVTLVLLVSGITGVEELRSKTPTQGEQSSSSEITLALETRVRNVGATRWQTEIVAHPGDQVEWLLNTKNVGLVPLTDVVTRAVLPSQMEIVSGSVEFTTAHGTKPLADAPLFSGGYNAGRYDPYDNSLIVFRTVVQDNLSPCKLRVRTLGLANARESPFDRGGSAFVLIEGSPCE